MHKSVVLLGCINDVAMCLAQFNFCTYLLLAFTFGSVSPAEALHCMMAMYGPLRPLMLINIYALSLPLMHIS